jgi:Leucine-rich repeat (LRR) protein
MKLKLFLLPTLLVCNVLFAQQSNNSSIWYQKSVNPDYSALNQLIRDEILKSLNPVGYHGRMEEWIQAEHLRLVKETEDKIKEYETGNSLLKSATATNEKDSLALVTLYYATNGLNWTNKSNWLVGPVSSWHGVYVTNGRVWHIILNSNNLNGYIPAEIGDLTELRSLYLGGNHLSGSIPPEIGQLTNLLTLALTGNQLTGQIPAEIGHLKKSMIFFMSDNQFSGQLPSELGQLSELLLLYLDNNQLSGSIPASFGQLKKLNHLLLYNNNLTGNIPASLGQMTNLSALMLSGNELTGQIPPELGNLSNLTSLQLFENQLTDTIPAELSKLSELMDLILNGNQLTGRIPAELSKLNNLYYLYLYDNQLSDTIPSELGYLQNLEELNLSSNQLTGKIPKELGQLSNLLLLSLSDNRLTGEIPDELRGLVNAEVLWLNNNRLTGKIPGEIRFLTNLLEIDLSANQLSGSLPVGLYELKNLQNLFLENNLLTGSIASNINSLDSLRIINIQKNKFDKIPDFSYMEKLAGLLVSDNKLMFDDIEENMDLIPEVEFIYSPQDSVGETKKLIKNSGEDLIYTIDVGGHYNEYQWYKNGVKLVSQTTKSLTINDLKYSDSGNYFCEVTNSIVPGLTLTCRIVTLQVAPSTEFCDYIYFQSGWNIFSLPGNTNVSDPETLFQPLIDNNSLIKIQDEQGNTFENWGIYGGWIDKIGGITTSEGYNVKVNKTDSLWICTVTPEFPYSIVLESGWNIMGYPLIQAYDAESILQQLIDKKSLIKIQDEKGNTIEDWGIYGGWVNNIGTFNPGKGFKIKLSKKDTLLIYDSYPKSSAILPEQIATTHFKPAFTGNGLDHTNINLVGLPLNILQAGDEIAVFDGTTCVGAVTLTSRNISNQSVSIAASAKDNQGMAGFTEGNPIMLKLWNSKQNTEYTLEPEILKGSAVFTKHETTFASLEKYATTSVEGIAGNGLTEINCYPNPFSDEVTIEIKLVKDSKVHVEVLNQIGQRVKFLQNEKLMNGGVHRLKWDGKSADNQKVSTGIYHLRITVDDTVLIRKMVYSK